MTSTSNGKASAASHIIAGSFDARSTSSHVEYRVLVPSDASGGERLPVILHLHGAMSSSASLESAKLAYDAAWLRNELPRAVVACASTPTLGGFYINQPDGPAWETLVADEFPSVLRQRFDIEEVRALIGFSMGGYGALKLAFRRPEHYVAVAALCPVVFPGETPTSVPERNRPSILGELHRAMGQDAARYETNSVYGILRSNLDRILDAGLGIYVDCGDKDEFGLHDGARYLESVLTSLNAPHEFRSIAGAAHADAAAARRLADAVAFLGRRLGATNAPHARVGSP